MRTLRAIGAAVIVGKLAAAAVAGPPTAAEVMKGIDVEYVTRTDEKLVSFGTRHSLSDATSATRGIGAAREWIKKEFESFGGGGGADLQSKVGGKKLQVSFEEFEAPKSTRVPQPTKFVNVVAVLPGTMPEAAGRRYYVVGHYDSMPSDVMNPKADAPGANDDASGTTAVLAIARAMAARPCEATIVFLCTAGEEQGLIGAKYHADQAATRKEDIRGVLSNDIVGDSSGPGGDPKRAERGLVRVFSEPFPRNASAEKLATIRNLGIENDSPSRGLARYMLDVAEKETTAVRPMLVFRQDRFLRGGDHSAFNEAGFAAVRLTEVYENYDHQHQTPRVEKRDGKDVQIGDLPEFVDIEYLTNVAKLNAAVLVNLANAPSSPGKARIITAKLEYTTTLRWEKSPEPDVAGYELVWRDTTAANWEHVKDVGNVVETTIDQSKDNLFFGVRAYDKDGYRSPVAFPGAAKE